jgi:hypothetical protein
VAVDQVISELVELQFLPLLNSMEDALVYAAGCNILWLATHIEKQRPNWILHVIEVLAAFASHSLHLILCISFFASHSLHLILCISLFSLPTALFALLTLTHITYIHYVY